MSERRRVLNAMRGLARKYKAMSLPVQRRNAVEDALYWRRIIRHT